MPKRQDEGRQTTPARTDTPKQPRTTVKLPADLHRKVRVVAGDLGLDLIEYLDQVLRPIVDEAYLALGHRITRESPDD